MSVSREVTTRAVILSRHGAGEGSARVMLYTETLGLVSALAKSAREERSKLRAHLLPGTFGTFRLVKGRDVWRVTGATDTKNIHFIFPEARAAREAAARFFDAVRQFVRGEGADPYLFSVLWGFSSALAEEADPKSAESLAALRMLSALGYVRENAAIAEFLTDAYDAETLSRAEKERGMLLKTINEAIAASGL